MRATIVGDPRGRTATELPHRAIVRKKRNTTRPRQRSRRGLSSETRGIDAFRYCFLVSAGFSVVLAAAPLPASALGCVPGWAAPVWPAGVAAFGSTFLASLPSLGVTAVLASAGFTTGAVASLAG